MQTSRRHRHPLPAFALLAFLLSACTSDILRETGSHPDGSPAFEREYLRLADGALVPHGAHATWHSGGARSTLRFFVRGRPRGYLLEWNERGEILRRARCGGGSCVELALPGEDPRTALALERPFRWSPVRLATAP